MPAPPSRSSLFPTGALLPATFKTLLAAFYDYVTPLLGASGNAADARTALGAAADSDVVKLTGAQTIADVKTFSARPIIPDATSAQNPVSKAQLDAEASARAAAISAAVAPATLAPALFVETTPKALDGLSVVEWTGIPTWAREIVIAISGQSGSSSGVAVVRIGTGGAAETTGYTGTASVVASSIAIAANSTSWRLSDSAIASSVLSHIVTISKVTGNTWAYTSLGAINSGIGTVQAGGDKALAGELDMVQLIMTAGTFDGGTATLYYR